MAALADSRPIEIVNLRHLRGEDLEPLLEEEVRVWRRRLHWDFSSSAELVRRYVEMRALNGFALWSGNHVAGYCYYVLEDQKALIGDLFVLDRAATPEIEHRLLESAFAEMVDSGGARRTESQLMMLRWAPDVERLTQRFRGLKMLDFSRYFMLAELDRIQTLPPRTSQPAVDIVPWSDRYAEEAARLIAICYQGHIDSRINDQYRSAAGARRFLTNIVTYPGCGQFYEQGSFAAFDQQTGALVGLSLSSLVAYNTGHITQICIAPSAQRTGMGYELMRHSLVELALHGCTEVSLTVTASNESAVKLYQQMGFNVIRDFAAHVWEWH